MAIALADVEVLMNVAVVGTDYTFFRIYEMPEATVQAYIDMAVRYCNRQIAAGTQTTYPDEYDDLCLVETALRICDHIYSEYQATGFSWSTLADSVNTGNYGQMIANRIAEYKNQKEELLGVLKQRCNLSQMNHFGPDPYGIMATNFVRTASWRKGA